MSLELTSESWNHLNLNVNGIDVHAVRQGPDNTDAPTLVLLHGWPEFWYAWHKIIPGLAENFDVIAPDLRGFGDSETPDSIPRIQDYIRDLEALMDALGIERAGLISHDVGAYVAQGFAQAFEKRVDGLFFFDCPYPGIGKRWVDASQVNEIWYQTFHQLDWAPELLRSSRDACRLYFQHFLRHWSGDEMVFGDDDIEIWVDNFLKDRNLEGGFAWYTSSNKARLAMIEHGPRPRPKIAARSFFLWGEKDPIIRAEWADKLGDYFDDFTLELAMGAGHFVAYEQPELAQARIASFFAPGQPR